MNSKKTQPLSLVKAWPMRRKDPKVKLVKGECCPFCHFSKIEMQAHETIDCNWFVRCVVCRAQGPRATNPALALALWDSRSREVMKIAFGIKEKA